MAFHKPTPYHLHIGRVLFASLAIVAVGLVNVPSLAFVQQHSEPSTDSSVLAYATNVSIGDLASNTNAARAQNGLGNFALNSKLNTSAQLKANDMIAKNYWSHVSPDGTQPWYWFGQAGYDYTNAGENLAYGFSDSSSTVTAWMNSAGHRANILGNYADMGFGIANGENYQGNPNTVIVAHYGTERAPAPAPTPAPTPAAPVAPTTPPAPTPPSTPAPVEEPATPTPTEPVPAAEAAESKEAADTSPTPSETTKPAAVATPTTTTGVPVWQQILSGSAPILAVISLSILAVVAVGYIATHVSLVRHAAIVGEQYILHHPLIDASVAIGASIIVLISTIGHVG